MKGNISIKGFKKNSPDVDNDYNVIPSGNLTMKGVQFPVLGVDNFGNKKLMMPGVSSYNFPGCHVTEYPIRQFGGDVDAGGLSPEDARQALIDGYIMGNPLTDIQRTHFASIAGTDEEGNLLDENGEIVDEPVQESDDEMRHGGQHNLHYRGQTSKNIKSSINELFLRNYNTYGKAGKHIYNPNAKQEGGETMKVIPMPPHIFGHQNPWLMQMGGDTEGDYENNFDNPFFQTGGAPQFKSEQEFHNWNTQQGNQLIPGEKKLYYNPKQFQYTPDKSRDSGYKINSLDPNITLGAYNAIPSQYTVSYQPPVQQIKQSNATGYIPFGQGTSGPKGYTKAGDTSGQQYEFRNGQYQPIQQAQVAATPTQKYGGQLSFQGGGEFLKSLVRSAYKESMKKGGQSSPQGMTGDDVLANRSNTFKSYLSNNTMKAIALEEISNLQDLHKQSMMNYGGGYAYGGQPKYQTKGEVSFEPAQNSEAYWNSLSGYNGGVNNQNPVQQNGPQLYPAIQNNGQQEITSKLSSDQLAGQQSVNTQRSQFDLMSNDMQNTSFQQGPQQKQKSNWMGGNGQLAAEGIIGGMNFLTAGLNARNTRSNENLLKQRTDADNVFASNQYGSANRGEYDVNSGKFKPNMNTPIQNRGNMRQGGEHEGEYMTKKQIRDLEAQGYIIHYLD